MEGSWLLSRPTLHANKPTFEMKETVVQRELFIVVNEMMNALEHVGKKLELQKEGSSNRII